MFLRQRCYFTIPAHLRAHHGLGHGDLLEVEVERFRHIGVSERFLARIIAVSRIRIPLVVRVALRFKPDDLLRVTVEKVEEKGVSYG